jgi:HEPN domain-containing protein
MGKQFSHTLSQQTICKKGVVYVRQSTQLALARSDIEKAQKRLKVLSLLLQEDGYSDVVREAQELVELALKGILFQAGIDPPKQHDIGLFFKERRDRLPLPAAREANRLAAISKRLGRERNASFYGDQDCIPAQEYNRQDAEQAMDDANFAFQLAKEVISEG